MTPVTRYPFLKKTGNVPPEVYEWARQFIDAANKRDIEIEKRLQALEP